MEFPKVDREKPIATVLSESDRASLLQMVRGSGYAVLLRIMEMRCILQDNALIATPTEDHNKIVAEQHKAVAKWQFLAEVQKQVAAEIEALLDEPPADTRPVEEREAEQVLNP